MNNIGNSHFYDMPFSYKNQELITFTIGAIVATAIATILIYLIATDKIQKYESYIDAMGETRSKITQGCVGATLGIVFSSIYLLFLIPFVCDHADQRTEGFFRTREQTYRPKTLTAQEREELNSVNLSIERAREILFYHDGVFHVKRVANLGPDIRSGFFHENDLTYYAKVEEHNNLRLALEESNSAQP